MSDEDNVDLDTQNQAADDTQDGVTDTDNNDTTQGNSPADEHDVDWYKKQNAKLFERAKTAEGFEKQPDGSWKKVVKKSATPAAVKPAEVKSDQLMPGLKDLIALQRAQVHEDDMERVTKFAKDEGLTIAEALKNEELGAILKLRTEQRKTTEVTNTSSSRRTLTKQTDEDILNNARGGLYPEDPDVLVEARINSKKRK